MRHQIWGFDLNNIAYVKIILESAKKFNFWCFKKIIVTSKSCINIIISDSLIVLLKFTFTPVKM